jgi:hypothetical protein
MQVHWLRSARDDIAYDVPTRKTSRPIDGVRWFWQRNMESFTGEENKPPTVLSNPVISQL